MAARGESEEFRYVGFWLRFLALAIDTVILNIILGPLTLYIFGPTYLATQDIGVMQERVMGLLTSPMFHLISVVLPLIGVILFWKFRAATPGKMLFSARIVDARTGGRMSTAQNIARAFAYAVSTVPFCIGFLWIAVDKRKQAWHDKLSRTVVVRPAKAGAGTAVFERPREDREPSVQTH